MGETDKTARKDDTPRDVSKVRVGLEDPRIPWWANWLLKAIMAVGIPAAILGAREARDWKYEGARLENEKGRISVEEKRNVIFERFEKVLYRVERKLPDERSNDGR